MEASASWKRCSSCKREIGFGATHWVCSVSTCNRKRTGLVFCSTECWDAHLAVVPHRESFAVEKRGPSRGEWEREQAEERAAAARASAGPPRVAGAPREARRVVERDVPPEPLAPPSQVPHEILVIASKLKAYIRARSGMSTSDAVMEPLSDLLRILADQAIRRAREAGRKTVLERDFKG
jgi:hypothetical protein